MKILHVVAVLFAVLPALIQCEEIIISQCNDEICAPKVVTKKKVILDHDGGIDDYMSLALLLTMPDVELLGVIATEADCLIDPSVSVSVKILHLMNRPDIKVAKSNVRGLHPFPYEWRVDSAKVNLFPVINENFDEATDYAKYITKTDGVRYMAQLIKENVKVPGDEKVTLVVLGPLTTVSTALERYPEIEPLIKEIIWMGGAINVTGNVAFVGHDGVAEWNAFWDPEAVSKVWQSSIPLILTPLDITNNAPITPDFIKALAKHRRYPLSDFAGQCYALVAFQAYFFWDVMATSYVGKPDLFTLKEWETNVITSGVSQGRIHEVKGGRKIHAMHEVDMKEFYTYVLQQWQK